MAPEPNSLSMANGPMRLPTCMRCTSRARNRKRKRSASACQPARCLARMIGQNHVGPGALDAGKNFQRDAALVDPALGAGRLDHRELAADIVRCHRHVKAVLYPTNDVEIRQG